MKKFFRSLLAKYMLIIILALSFVQIAFLFVVLLVAGVAMNIENSYTSDEEDYAQIEENWHKDANELETEADISHHFSKWHNQYPDASMFWVDQTGVLRQTTGEIADLPEVWTPTDTAKFIKERYGANPFTVLAFVGEEDANGFVVFEINRDTFLPPIQVVMNQFGYWLLLGPFSLVLLFIFMSFLFFRGIRKRLLQLQEAMEIRDVDELPIKIEVKKLDEIGQLEQTFNQMVQELRVSKKREEEEEQLRRELIANLSHDLRTPLTKINAQTFKIAKQDISGEVKQSIDGLESSVSEFDKLIENLMSYTLLMASKYKLDLQDVDIDRLVRENIATWYPVFEKEAFEINVELQPLHDNIWHLDPMWLRRILDNLLQNVLRHAKDGAYIEVRTESIDGYDLIIVRDKGSGMTETSNDKGAGIGLSIVDMMVKELQLEWEVQSGSDGTTIIIKKSIE
ncbi:HAMP domain-containing sensor histidine kinase [Gracilibacillus sp. S3-1-1]|uniref:HAMP domain-containing sensor histidine kinase n=1 Tax=Gracilibacillus pellucidus TaxID=3095368 RepID=A0ACC6M6K8_9BACI|nr:HAMP domain-containing sensor histidine kinase [Gracilibacillus sp. S3-1-1]MDX8046487.1 HAMP domain-containing sensor histidine kinase [Gracilibacillus sp. S3-1-1]